MASDVPVNTMQAYGGVSFGVIYRCPGAKLDYYYPSYFGLQQNLFCRYESLQESTFIQSY